MPGNKKAIRYPVWFTEEEVKTILYQNYLTGVFGSIIVKIKSAAMAKGQNDPIAKLIEAWEHEPPLDPKDRNRT